jgi:hypothetical protein
LALSACLWVAAVALGLGRPHVAGVADFGAGDAAASLVLLVFVAVGTLIVTRRPSNRIGWLFCAIGLPALLGSFATQYAVAALLACPAGAAGRAGEGVAGGLGVGRGLSLFFYLLVLFPDGHLPSRRWRPVAWLYGGALVVGLAAATVWPGTTAVFLGDLGPIRNPLGRQQAAAAVRVAEGVSRLVTTVLLPVGAVGLALRLRRSRGVERQQLKWAAFAGGVLAAAILAEGWCNRSAATAGCWARRLARCSSSAGCWGSRSPPEWGSCATGCTTSTAGQPHPGLRAAHRAAGRRLRRPGAGARAGVRPLLQPGGGDRHADGRSGVPAGPTPHPGRSGPALHRRRYDAATTIAAFSARLRQQLDLEALTAELLAVVDQTMAPTGAWLWLRASAPPPDGRTPPG